jgi:hypothetical protein
LIDRLVPAGVIYGGGGAANVAWTAFIDGTGQARVPPVTVQCFDQEAYDIQRARFGDWQIPMVAPGVIRQP